MENNLRKKLVCIIMIFVISIPTVGLVPVAKADNVTTAQTFTTLGQNLAVILDNGELWMWGVNGGGQLGNGTKSQSNIPIKVMDKVRAVDGDGHMAALKIDGSLWTWGGNNDGQLGDGTTKNRTKPVKIMDKVEKISVSGGLTAAIKTDGSLWMWGSTYYDRICNIQFSDNQQRITAPRKVMDNVADIYASTFHTVVLKKDGSLWTWGQNDEGQLGNNTTTASVKPIKIMKDVIAISAGSFSTYAIKKDGSLWAWGDNRYGQLGDGTYEAQYKPIRIMDNIVAVVSNSVHAAAIKSDGSLWTWGGNTYGLLGNGSEYDTAIPQKVLENVAAVDSDMFYTAALRKDGSLWVSGKNTINPVSNVPVKVIENVSLGNIKPHTIPYKTDKNIKVLINDQLISFKQPPIMREDNILVSAKELLNGLGASYQWNKASKTVTAVKDSVTVIMQTGYNYITRNNKQSLLSTPPQYIDGAVYIPVKEAADAFSAFYDWSESTNTVVIKVLDPNTTKQLVKYEEKMKVFGFDRIYDNERATSQEPVTKAEALKIAISVIFNKADISDIAGYYDSYKNATWVEYAKINNITSEDINSDNYDDYATYIDVITYFENCKIRYLDKYPVKSTDVDLEDLLSYSEQEQVAIKDMIANQIIRPIGDKISGRDYVTKGQLNEIVVNFAQRYSTITLEGDELVRDKAVLPSNADLYPYILAKVDKKIYEIPFFYGGWAITEATPKDIYWRYKEYYPIMKAYIDEAFAEMLNVDYRTISEKDFMNTSKGYFIIGLDQKHIDWYVKHVKKNKIILKGDCELQEPILFSDGLGVNVRLKLTFEVISSNTKDNLLFLDSYGDSNNIYKKKKYDIVVDYPLGGKYGSDMMYLETKPLYDFIFMKEKSGIVEE